MSSLELPSLELLAEKGRVATLGQFKASNDTRELIELSPSGMFIIDHFQVQDEMGRSVPVDEPAVCLGHYPQIQHMLIYLA